MTKRILSAVLAMVMLISLGTVAYADDPATVKEAIYKYGTETKFFANEQAVEAWLSGKTANDVEVTADVKIKNASGTFVDAPVSNPVKLKGSNINNISTDIKAEIDMTAVKAKFDEYVNGAKLAINTVGGANTEALLAALNNIEVTGTFAITINVPDGMILPDSAKNNTALIDFDAVTQANFYQIGERNYTDNVLTINVGVGASADNKGLTKAQLDSVLTNDLVLTCSGVKFESFNTYTITGEFDGETTIWQTAETDGIATVTYKSTIDSATVTVEKSSGTSTGGGSSIVDVEFYVNGKLMRTMSGRSPFTVDISEIVPEEIPEGFEFAGWYTDKELTIKAESPLEATKDTNLYAKFVIKGGDVLNKDDHFAYIIGYTDGTVRPLNNILREEVAAIFFRLLTEEAGEAAHATVAPFSDVPADKWSSTAIATMAKGGFITGRDDGTFGPELNITRAEFATIAARFSSDVYGTALDLSDISGHWAKNYIDVCTANGWITGYPDGTFKPDQCITRAEAMAIVNRMLDRAVDEKGTEAVKEDIYLFRDNPQGSWCYYIVLEATNSHDFVRAEGEAYETWTKITEIRDWTVYE